MSYNTTILATALNETTKELAKKFAKSSVAYDELESIGYAFYGNPGIDHPMFSNKMFYGEGLKGDFLLNLANRYKRGFKTEQTKLCFDRDLAVGLRGKKGVFADSIRYEAENDGYLLIFKDMSHKLTYAQVAEAYLSMAKEEYENSLDLEDMTDDMIRSDFTKALDRVKKSEYGDYWDVGKISFKLGFGFSDEDIRNLAIIHRDKPEYRDKIFSLMEDCNFHSVNSDFEAGKYTKYTGTDDTADTQNDIDMGTFSVDVKLQKNGKYDVYIAHEGSSGSHYTDVTADKIGELVAEDIECLAEGYQNEFGHVA